MKPIQHHKGTLHTHLFTGAQYCSPVFFLSLLFHWSNIIRQRHLTHALSYYVEEKKERIVASACVDIHSYGSELMRYRNNEAR